jgi:predicted Zn-dependent protease
MIARVFVAVAALAAPAFAETENATLVKALRDELARVPKLQLPGVAAPYHVAYQAIDLVKVTVAATFGAVSSNDTERERYLRTDLRVGDTMLDSSNFFTDSFGFGGGREVMQTDDDYHALRREIWHVTDRVYKQAIERLEKKKAAQKSQVTNPDRVGDYTTAEAVQYVSPKTLAPVDAKALEDLVIKASAAWKQIPALHGGKATATVISQKRLLVTTEGSTVTEPRQVAKIVMTIDTQAPDGMRLDHQYVAVASVDALPKADELAATAKKMADELVARAKVAPAEAYTGPVLFESAAAAQLVRALLVAELSGTPPMSGGDRFARMLPKGSELGDKVGKRIVPIDFRIEDDPTIDKLGARPLIGGYAVDDEGVKAQKVTLVEKGLLKSFLMSRAPRKGELKSNGHGRADLGGEARAYPSNMIITAQAGVADAELKRRLLARARADGLTYAIVIRQLEDPSATERSRTFMFGDQQNESKVPRPLVAVRVGLDGKETPIRGLVFGAMPLRTLRAISAAGKTPAVLSYLAGGSRYESSTIPVSIAAPALLFDDLELVKDSTVHHKPPVLPRL